MTAATNNIQQPSTKVLSKGPISSGPGHQLVDQDVWLNLSFNGVPGEAQGQGWAGKASTGFDATTGVWYINTGTKAVPNWVASGSGGGGITLSDGSTTVDGATSLTVTGGTVGGTTPNATLNITGGGAPTFTLTASGDIAAGSAVSVNSSGEAVQTWGPAPNFAGEVTLFPAPTANGSTAQEPGMAPGILEMSSTVYVSFGLCPQNSGRLSALGGAFPLARVVTQSGGSLTLGTLNTDASFGGIIGYAKLSSTAFIYAYISSGSVYVNVATITGSGGSAAIVVGGSPQAVSGATDAGSVRGAAANYPFAGSPVVSLTASLAVFVYQDGSEQAWVLPIGISGTTLTLGTPNSNTSALGLPLVPLVMSATEIMLVYYVDTFFAAYTAVTALAVVIATPVDLGVGTQNFSAVSNGTTFLVTWVGALSGTPANAYVGNAVAGSFTGTTAEWGTPITVATSWPSGNGTPPFPAFLSASEVAFYNGWSLPSFASLSGTSLDLVAEPAAMPLPWDGIGAFAPFQNGTGIIFYTTNVFAPPMAGVDTTHVIFEDGAWSLYEMDASANLSPKIEHQGLLFYALYPVNSSFVLAVFVDYAGNIGARMIGFEAMNSTPPIGITALGATSGNPVTIQNAGAVTGLSGLMPGDQYFSNGDGSLVAANTGHLMGTAISATKLALNIQSP